MTLRFLWEPWLLLLVGLPLLAIVGHGLYRARRDGDGMFVPWLRRLGMVLMVLIIGATPAVPGDGPAVTSNVDVYIVVDRTGSMAAEDFNGTEPRLNGVRHDMVALTEALPAARFSIIAWDSSASRQLPLTVDTRAVKTWAETLQQESTAYSAGSAIDRPLLTLRRALESNADTKPENVRLVFFLSDGENTDGDDSSRDASPDGYAELAQWVDGGAVFGYGTAEGGRMRKYGINGVEDEYITDRSTGQDAISRIDEENLTALAANLGVDYVHRNDYSDLSGVADGIDIEAILEDGRVETRVLRDVYWPFTWVLAGLLAWEAYEQLRAIRMMGGPRGKRT